MLPSELARLVLAYLHEESCPESAACFLRESRHLAEVAQLPARRQSRFRYDGRTMWQVVQEFVEIRDSLDGKSDTESIGHHEPPPVHNVTSYPGHRVPPHPTSSQLLHSPQNQPQIHQNPHRTPNEQNISGRSMNVSSTHRTSLNKSADSKKGQCRHKGLLGICCNEDANSLLSEAVKEVVNVNSCRPRTLVPVKDAPYLAPEDPTLTPQCDECAWYRKVCRRCKITRKQEWPRYLARKQEREKGRRVDPDDTSSQRSEETMRLVIQTSPTRSVASMASTRRTDLAVQSAYTADGANSTLSTPRKLSPRRKMTQPRRGHRKSSAPKKLRKTSAPEMGESAMVQILEEMLSNQGLQTKMADKINETVFKPPDPPKPKPAPAPQLPESLVYGETIEEILDMLDHEVVAAPAPPPPPQMPELGPFQLGNAVLTPSFASTSVLSSQATSMTSQSRTVVTPQGTSSMTSPAMLLATSGVTSRATSAVPLQTMSAITTRLTSISTSVTTSQTAPIMTPQSTLVNTSFQQTSAATSFKQMSDLLAQQSRHPTSVTSSSTDSVSSKPIMTSLSTTTTSSVQTVSRPDDVTQSVTSRSSAIVSTASVSVGTSLLADDASRKNSTAMDNVKSSHPVSRPTALEVLHRVAGSMQSAKSNSTLDEATTSKLTPKSPRTRNRAKKVLDELLLKSDERTDSKRSRKSRQPKKKQTPTSENRDAENLKSAQSGQVSTRNGSDFSIKDKKYRRSKSLSKEKDTVIKKTSSVTVDTDTCEEMDLSLAMSDSDRDSPREEDARMLKDDLALSDDETQQQTAKRKTTNSFAPNNAKSSEAGSSDSYSRPVSQSGQQEISNAIEISSDKRGSGSNVKSSLASKRNTAVRSLFLSGKSVDTKESEVGQSVNLDQNREDSPVESEAALPFDPLVTSPDSVSTSPEVKDDLLSCHIDDSFVVEVHRVIVTDSPAKTSKAKTALGPRTPPLQMKESPAWEMHDKTPEPAPASSSSPKRTPHRTPSPRRSPGSSMTRALSASPSKCTRSKTTSDHVFMTPLKSPAPRRSKPTPGRTPVKGSVHPCTPPQKIPNMGTPVKSPFSPDKGQGRTPAKAHSSRQEDDGNLLALLPKNNAQKKPKRLSPSKLFSQPRDVNSDSFSQPKTPECTSMSQMSLESSSHDAFRTVSKSLFELLSDSPQVHPQTQMLYRWSTPVSRKANTPVRTDDSQYEDVQADAIASILQKTPKKPRRLAMCRIATPVKEASEKIATGPEQECAIASILNLTPVKRTPVKQNPIRVQGYDLSPPRCHVEDSLDASCKPLPKSPAKDASHEKSFDRVDTVPVPSPIISLDESHQTEWGRIIRSADQDRLDDTAKSSDGTPKKLSQNDTLAKFAAGNLKDFEYPHSSNSAQATSKEKVPVMPSAPLSNEQYSSLRPPVVQPPQESTLMGHFQPSNTTQHPLAIGNETMNDLLSMTLDMLPPAPVNSISKPESAAEKEQPKKSTQPELTNDKNPQVKETIVIDDEDQDDDVADAEDADQDKIDDVNEGPSEPILAASPEHLSTETTTVVTVPDQPSVPANKTKVKPKRSKAPTKDNGSDAVAEQVKTFTETTSAAAQKPSRIPLATSTPAANPPKSRMRRKLVKPEQIDMRVALPKMSGPYDQAALKSPLPGKSEGESMVIDGKKYLAIPVTNKTQFEARKDAEIYSVSGNDWKKIKENKGKANGSFLKPDLNMNIPTVPLTSIGLNMNVNIPKVPQTAAELLKPAPVIASGLPGATIVTLPSGVQVILAVQNGEYVPFTMTQNGLVKLDIPVLQPLKMPSTFSSPFLKKPTVVVPSPAVPVVCQPPASTTPAATVKPSTSKTSEAEEPEKKTKKKKKSISRESSETVNEAETNVKKKKRVTSRDRKRKRSKENDEQPAISVPEVNPVVSTAVPAMREKNDDIDSDGSYLPDLAPSERIPEIKPKKRLRKKTKSAEKKVEDLGNELVIDEGTKKKKKKKKNEEDSPISSEQVRNLKARLANRAKDTPKSRVIMTAKARKAQIDEASKGKETHENRVDSVVVQNLDEELIIEKDTESSCRKNDSNTPDPMDEEVELDCSEVLPQSREFSPESCLGKNVVKRHDENVNENLSRNQTKDCEVSLERCDEQMRARDSNVDSAYQNIALVSKPNDKLKVKVVSHEKRPETAESDRSSNSSPVTFDVRDFVRARTNEQNQDAKQIVPPEKQTPTVPSHRKATSKYKKSSSISATYTEKIVTPSTLPSDLKKALDLKSSPKSSTSSSHKAKSTATNEPSHSLHLLEQNKKAPEVNERMSALKKTSQSVVSKSSCLSVATELTRVVSAPEKSVKSSSSVASESPILQQPIKPSAEQVVERVPKVWSETVHNTTQPEDLKTDKKKGRSTSSQTGSLRPAKKSGSKISYAEYRQRREKERTDRSEEPEETNISVIQGKNTGAASENCGRRVPATDAGNVSELYNTLLDKVSKDIAHRKDLLKRDRVSSTKNVSKNIHVAGDENCDKSVKKGTEAVHLGQGDGYEKFAQRCKDVSRIIDQVEKKTSKIPERRKVSKSPTRVEAVTDWMSDLNSQAVTVTIEKEPLRDDFSSKSDRKREELNSKSSKSAPSERSRGKLCSESSSREERPSEPRGSSELHEVPICVKSPTKLSNVVVSPDMEIRSLPTESRETSTTNRRNQDQVRPKNSVKVAVDKPKSSITADEHLRPIDRTDRVRRSSETSCRSSLPSSENPSPVRPETSQIEENQLVTPDCSQERKAVKRPAANEDSATKPKLEILQKKMKRRKIDKFLANLHKGSS